MSCDHPPHHSLAVCMPEPAGKLSLAAPGNCLLDIFLLSPAQTRAIGNLLSLNMCILGTTSFSSSFPKIRLQVLS